jgi:hypothetical protein
MCRKNITQPFNFICYTDDSTGIVPEVNIIPYVDYGLDLIVYNKLYLFSEKFDRVIPEGPRVYFDLDLIIKSNIDDIVNDNKGELTLIRPVWRSEHRRGPPIWHHMFNSSCMTWTSPNTRCLWEHLQKDPEMFMAKYYWGMDSYMSYEHQSAGTNIHYFPALKFYSYLYGLDINVQLQCDPIEGAWAPSRFKHITDNIPFILLNGPTTVRDYQKFKQFYED